MLREGRDELICDLAETYHLFDIRAHKARSIAILAAGLRENSRIRMKMEGRRLTDTDSLLALIFDKANWLCWAKTKDAQHGQNRPKSMYQIMTENRETHTEGFNSIEEFKKIRKELAGESNE